MNEVGRKLQILLSKARIKEKKNALNQLKHHLKEPKFISEITKHTIQSLFSAEYHSTSDSSSSLHCYREHLTWDGIISDFCQFIHGECSSDRIKSNVASIQWHHDIVNVLLQLIETSDARQYVLFYSIKILLGSILMLVQYSLKTPGFKGDSVINQIIIYILQVECYCAYLPHDIIFQLIEIYSMMMTLNHSEISKSNAKVMKSLMTCNMITTHFGSCPSSIELIRVFIDQFAHRLITFDLSDKNTLNIVVETLNTLITKYAVNDAQAILMSVGKQVNAYFIRILSKSTSSLSHASILSIIHYFRLAMTFIYANSQDLVQGSDMMVQNQPKRHPNQKSRNPVQNDDLGSSETWISSSSSVNMDLLLLFKCQCRDDSELFTRLLALADLKSRQPPFSSLLIQTSNINDLFNHIAIFDLLARMFALNDEMVYIHNPIYANPASLIDGQYLSSGHSPDKKRQKLEFHDLRLYLNHQISPENSNATSLLNWLKLLTILFLRYPNFLSAKWTLKFTMDVFHLFKAKHDLDTKILWFSRCLIALAYTSYHCLKREGDTENSGFITNLKSLWRLIWENSLYKLGSSSGSPGSESVLLLMQALISLRLLSTQSVLDTQETLWKLPIFMRTISPSSIQFLVALIHHYPIKHPSPDPFNPGDTSHFRYSFSDLNSSPTYFDANDVRHALNHWLSNGLKDFLCEPNGSFNHFNPLDFSKIWANLIGYSGSIDDQIMIRMMKSTGFLFNPVDQDMVLSLLKYWKCDVELDYSLKEMEDTRMGFHIIETSSSLLARGINGKSRNNMVISAWTFLLSSKQTSLNSSSSPLNNHLSPDQGQKTFKFSIELQTLIHSSIQQLTSQLMDMPSNALKHNKDSISLDHDQVVPIISKLSFLAIVITGIIVHSFYHFLDKKTTGSSIHHDTSIHVSSIHKPHGVFEQIGSQQGITTPKEVPSQNLTQILNFIETNIRFLKPDYGFFQKLFNDLKQLVEMLPNDNTFSGHQYQIKNIIFMFINAELKISQTNSIACRSLVDDEMSAHFISISSKDQLGKRYCFENIACQQPSHNQLASSFKKDFNFSQTQTQANSSIGDKRNNEYPSTIKLKGENVDINHSPYHSNLYPSYSSKSELIHSGNHNFSSNTSIGYQAVISSFEIIYLIISSNTKHAFQATTQLFDILPRISPYSPLYCKSLLQLINSDWNLFQSDQIKSLLISIESIFDHPIIQDPSKLIVLLSCLLALVQKINNPQPNTNIISYIKPLIASFFSKVLRIHDGDEKTVHNQLLDYDLHLQHLCAVKNSPQFRITLAKLFLAILKLPVEYIGDEKYNQINFIFCQILLDPSILVRQHFTKLLISFLDIYQVNLLPEILYDLFKNQFQLILYSCSTSPETNVLTLLTITQILLTFPSLEIPILIYFHQLCHPSSIFSNYISFLLDMISNVLGYPNKYLYIQTQSKAFFSAWKNPISQFPAYLYNAMSTHNFLSANLTSIIIGITIPTMKDDHRQELASFREQDFNELLQIVHPSSDAVKWLEATEHLKIYLTLLKISKYPGLMGLISNIEKQLDRIIEISKPFSLTSTPSNSPHLFVQVFMIFLQYLDNDIDKQENINTIGSDTTFSTTALNFKETLDHDPSTLIQAQYPLLYFSKYIVYLSLKYYCQSMHDTNHPDTLSHHLQIHLVSILETLNAHYHLTNRFMDRIRIIQSLEFIAINLENQLTSKPLTLLLIFHTIFRFLLDDLRPEVVIHSLEITHQILRRTLKSEIYPFLPLLPTLVKLMLVLIDPDHKWSISKDTYSANEKENQPFQLNPFLSISENQIADKATMLIRSLFLDDHRFDDVLSQLPPFPLLNDTLKELNMKQLHLSPKAEYQCISFIEQLSYPNHLLINSSKSILAGLTLLIEKASLPPWRWIETSYISLNDVNTQYNQYKSGQGQPKNLSGEVIHFSSPLPEWLVESIRTLIHYASRINVKTILSKIGELLGNIGVLSVDDSLNHRTTTQLGIRLGFFQDHPFEYSANNLNYRSTLTQHNNGFDIFLTTTSTMNSRYLILSHLVRMLETTSTNVFSQTVQCLKKILSTPIGFETWETCDLKLHQSLSCFTSFDSSLPSNHDHCQEQLSSSKKLSLNIDWLETKPYEAWITSVAQKLASSCDADPFIQLCSPLCQFNIHLSEQLIIFLLLNWISHSPSSSSLMHMAKYISNCFKIGSQNQSIVLAQKRIFLFLIELLITLLRVGQFKSNCEKSNSITQLDKSINTHNQLEMAQTSETHIFIWSFLDLPGDSKEKNANPRTWIHPFWMALNFEHVAYVAMLLSCPHCSILFAECHFRDRLDSTTSGGSHSMILNAPLLSTIYAMVNDSDFLHNMNQFNGFHTRSDAMARFLRLRHERNWVETIGLFENLQHQHLPMIHNRFPQDIESLSHLNSHVSIGKKDQVNESNGENISQQPTMKQAETNELNTTVRPNHSSIFTLGDNPHPNWSMYQSMHDPIPSNSNLSNVNFPNSLTSWSNELISSLNGRSHHNQLETSFMSQNTLQSLQYLGYHHIIKYYLDGLLRSTSSSSFNPTITEFQYQTAWRHLEFSPHHFSNYKNWIFEETIGFDHDEFGQINHRFNKMKRRSSNATNMPKSTIGFNRMIYESLLSLCNHRTDITRQLVDDARARIIQEISIYSTEIGNQVQLPLLQLEFFSDLSLAVHLHDHYLVDQVKTDGSSLSTTCLIVDGKSVKKAQVHDRLEQLVSSWKKSNQKLPLLFSGRFEQIEPILSLRGILIPLIVPHQLSIDHIKLEFDYWLSVAHLSRKAQQYHFSESALWIAQTLLEGTSSQNKESSSWQHSEIKLQLEEAKLLWDQSKVADAISLAKRIIGASSKADVCLKAQLLLVVGRWLQDSRLENPITILQQYFQSAYQLLLKASSDNEGRCKSHYLIAKFSDDQYQEALVLRETPEWIIRGKLKNEMIHELGESYLSNQPLEFDPSNTKPSRSALSSYHRMLASESNFIHPDDHTSEYLRSAVRNYLFCLIKGFKYDIQAMFRFISLWFSNSSKDEYISLLLRDNMLKIKSSKFLPLFYQIASRLAPEVSLPSSNLNPSGKQILISPTIFQQVIRQLITNLVVEYPYMTLYRLFSLIHRIHHDQAKNIEKICPNLSRSNLTLFNHSSTIRSHHNMVSDFLNQIRQRHNEINLIIDQVQILVDAYIELALFKLSSQNQPSRSVKSHAEISITQFSLSSIRNTTIPVTTIQTHSLGQNPVFIHGFSTTAKLVGGINFPKLVTCMGSDGVEYPQLVKGNDDLSQDAVMLQLFDTMNLLLRLDHETNKRKLSIRTYKVIPLGPNAGVLEWIQNTQLLMDYLPKAHHKYHPSDLTHSQCMAQYKLSRKYSREQQTQSFLQITNQFQPVFHHFFLENFVDASIWFQRRLTYTRSTATASMVGYLVGLGDRHSSNILIDRNSAQIIHIDLGVAFEQGKALPVPELVPFRLTRDIVDGMGISGVYGVFMRSCEHSMRVMRERHEILMTVVEVFLHDPLHRWTLERGDITRRQHGWFEDRSLITNRNEKKNKEDGSKPMGSGMAPISVQEGNNRNKRVQSALLRIKQKLQGQEQGTMISVQGRVHQLITEAQDPELLSKMFVGWAPWI